VRENAEVITRNGATHNGAARNALDREGARASAEWSDDPRHVGNEVNGINGIFSHAEPPATPSRSAPTAAVPPAAASAAASLPPQPAPTADDRPRQVTIVDTQVRRRKLRGSIGVVLGWSNEALNVGAKLADASLTVMRVSIDLHLRTRAARVDYAKTFSFAMGREVGPSRATPIDHGSRMEPADAPPLDLPARTPAPSDTQYHRPESPAYRSPSVTVPHAPYRAPSAPLGHAPAERRSVQSPYVTPARGNGGNGANGAARRATSYRGGYGPGN
jgi:hypothetical protein